MRRGLVAILGWALAASSATAVSVAAIDVLGEGITGGTVQPLSPAEVDRALDEASPTDAPAASPSGSGSPPGSPGTAGVVRVLTVDGGSVVASCAGDAVTIQSWSPDQGFTADVKDRGPDRTATVEFESDDEEYEVDLRCDASGAPQARTVSADLPDDDDDDDAGDDGGDDGSGDDD